MVKKNIRIGFDLDGVIIGKPPFIPNYIMEKLVRNPTGKKLGYRYPKYSIERKIRILSHYPLFRPPIRNNINLIKELYKSNAYTLYVVSSRYSFLKSRTRQWFGYYKLRRFFKEIYINDFDEQPHLFKERMIKRLGLHVFIDDDLLLLKYLRTRSKDIDLIYVKDHEKYVRGILK
ncbi:hypothetical protein A3A76_04900 [Candidatus Woesebacteria bacterium RIFCSPLOWO2_01_FULL_39_23]|uniref:Uncharacterized protein n=2 Tax=Microgenomates group TaxID=1794810 RepID=A0A0H4T6A2_9BACT|nr:hypothetical protein [uncultured Microgenomates bacterium Rifle_16ft_4_minimus_37633]OGM13821.1 MAG: hypothetical protein A2141_04125 [Candidatus Woesebacteria bacterium RBG_16_40_11]OGM27771.1 MAG: hypothetical protein A2628_05120 [Candidatus Woesebacteria bacterium RIFCSPHIGHO2_01_FULL_40_22]OGM36215.1 MAG: hypothetical protein A3E41_00890 [Candidatus Woesebacteria bacterium RIFCSPHIGHO2_12_FULL_38_9]OGM62193.1 MAG: hypothetical protein A3A76_04900 [Candidatus Woesebacteria bacterium RIFCS